MNNRYGRHKHLKRSYAMRQRISGCNVLQQNKNDEKCAQVIKGNVASGCNGSAGVVYRCNTSFS